jgi:hypothetical protein
MSVAVRLVVLVLATTPLVAVAQDASKPTCGNFVFSKEFLKAYPKGPAACSEVVVKDGIKWVRFDANVTDVNGNEVTADFLNPMKAPVLTLTFTAPPDATLDVGDGKQAKFSTLRNGEEIYVWAPESRVGFYAAPGALNSGKLKVIKGKAD